ncbi:MAG: NUDIX hydrolase [Bacillota bacterium]
MINYPRQIVTVTGMIENEQGELLLIKSPRRGWEPPGGQVELGEDLIEAVVRETKEESGFDVTITETMGIYQNTGSPKSEPKVCVVFRGRLVGGEAQTSNESLDVGWFSREAARQMVTAPQNALRLSDYLDHTGRVVYKAYRVEPEHQVRRTLA